MSAIVLKEVSVIGAAVRRAKGRLRRGAEEELTQGDLEDLCGSFRAARSEISALIELAEKHKETPDAGSGHKDSDPRAA